MAESRPDAPLVSVITVVRNGAAHLEQAMSSVYAQDYPNVEYIVVDGGSTDGTLDLIRSFDDRIDYWVSEQDRGIYDAMNKGLAQARGELTAFLNADDFYAPEAVRAVVERYMEAGRPEGIVYGDTQVRMEDLGIDYRLPANLDFWRGMPICHQAMFVHRQAFEMVGLFDTRYRLAADFDFLIRAIQADLPLLRVDKVLVNFRTSGQSIGNPFPLIRENRAVLRAWFGLGSSVYWRFLLLCLRDVPLLKLRDGLRKLLGERVVLALRRIYTRCFIARR